MPRRISPSANAMPTPSASTSRSVPSRIWGASACWNPTGMRSRLRARPAKAFWKADGDCELRGKGEHSGMPTQSKGVLVSWSGGKDSCLALYEIQKTPGLHVEALLTTLTRDFDRISMHGVRRVLL